MANTSCEPEPSDGLKAFGAALKVFREWASLTQEQLAERVCYSVHFVASIEQGRRIPPGDFVERAEEALDAFGVLRATARHVARQPGLAAWFRHWAQLESTAVSLCTYECRVVPGLLQTEAYARAVMLNVPPPPTEEEVEQWNVELQIMTLRQPQHAGADGPMRLLEAQDHQWLGYAEGQQTGQLISDRKDVSLMQMRYAKMRSQALSPADSAELLKRMRGAI
jgi:transcriptional regulator with XRE-family HTH domain